MWKVYKKERASRTVMCKKLSFLCFLLIKLCAWERREEKEQA